MRSLDAAGVQEGALAERALGLRARALTRLGRHAEAEAVARHYLARYPAGGLAAWMRERVATAEAAPRESSGVGAE